MAKATYSLGVELAGDEVRLALVERTDQGASLLSTQTVAAKDDLARVFRSLPRRPSAVCCAVGLEHAAIRILNLPATTEENLARVVALEAEAVLPLSADELALSQHMLGMNEQSRLEVLVAAARQSEVQEALKRTNVLPSVGATATVSGIALINAVNAIAGPAREPVCALLRVEERTSELIVVDRTRVVVAQSLPIGCGATLPAGTPIAGGVPVAAGGGRSAEAAPAASPGTSGLGGPPLEWVTLLAQQVRYALQAVSYERGIQIQRLYLCGKGALAEGADWQLSERLDLALTRLSPAEKLADGARYAVAYGCGLQAAGEAQFPLSLTLARVTVAREVEQRRQSRFSWIALVGSLALTAAMAFGVLVVKKQQTIAALEARVREVGPVAPQAPVAPATLKTGATAIAEALKVRVTPARALTVLSRQLPTGTWLAELTYSSETGCVVRGFSTDANGAQRAQIALLRQELFDEVTLDYRIQQEVAGVPVWGFQLSCKLKPKDKGRGGVRRS